MDFAKKQLEKYGWTEGMIFFIVIHIYLFTCYYFYINTNVEEFYNIKKNSHSILIISLLSN